MRSCFDFIKLVFYTCRLECLFGYIRPFASSHSPLLRHIARYAPQQPDKYTSKIHLNSAVYKIKTASEYPQSALTCRYAAKSRGRFLDFPYIPYHAMKRPVLLCNMARFSLRNSTFSKAERPVLQLSVYQTIGRGNHRGCL